MNLTQIKRYILSKKNQYYHFIYKGPRNQIEEFDGIITDCFPSIFIVVTKDNVTKSFSYNDFIVKNIKIISCDEK